MPRDVEHPAATLRIRRSVAYEVLVVPDCPDGGLSRTDRQALAAGRQLAGDRGGLVVATCVQVVPGLKAESVDRVLALPGSRDPASIADALHAAGTALTLRHTIFPATEQGGDRARRLAAVSGQALAHAVLAIEDGHAIQPAGDDLEAVIALPPVVLLAATFEGPPPADTGEALVSELDLSPARPSSVQYGPPVRPSPETVSLVDADAILAGGNGVGDWASFLALARVLDIPVGASRVAVDKGRISRARQVGASGSIVTARSYLAFGISGAPQHLEGIGACEAVLAVNIDPTCAMMSRADLAVVADADAVVQSMLQALEAGHV